VQKVLDAAEASGLGADRLDQAPRAGVDAVLGVPINLSLPAKAGKEKDAN